MHGDGLRLMELRLNLMMAMGVQRGLGHGWGQGGNGSGNRGLSGHHCLQIVGDTDVGTA